MVSRATVFDAGAGEHLYRISSSIWTSRASNEYNFIDADYGIYSEIENALFIQKLQTIIILTAIHFCKALR